MVRVRTAALLLVTALLGGCGSITNLIEGPEVFGGVRTVVSGPPPKSPVSLAFYNLPLSFLLDLALLPVTLTAEGVRLVTGWPPRGTAPPVPETFDVVALEVPRPDGAEAHQEAMLGILECERRLLAEGYRQTFVVEEDGAIQLRCRFVGDGRNRDVLLDSIRGIVLADGRHPFGEAKLEAR